MNAVLIFGQYQARIDRHWRDHAQLYTAVRQLRLDFEAGWQRKLMKASQTGHSVRGELDSGASFFPFARSQVNFTKFAHIAIGKAQSARNFFLNVENHKKTPFAEKFLSRPTDPWRGGGLGGREPPPGRSLALALARAIRQIGPQPVSWRPGS